MDYVEEEEDCVTLQKSNGRDKVSLQAADERGEASFPSIMEKGEAAPESSNEEGEASEFNKLPKVSNYTIFQAALMLPINDS